MQLYANCCDMYSEPGLRFQGLTYSFHKHSSTVMLMTKINCIFPIIIAVIIGRTDIIYDNIFLTRVKVLSLGYTTHLVLAARGFCIVLWWFLFTARRDSCPRWSSVFSLAQVIITWFYWFKAFRVHLYTLTLTLPVVLPCICYLLWSCSFTLPYTIHGDDFWTWKFYYLRIINRDQQQHKLHRSRGRTVVTNNTWSRQLIQTTGAYSFYSTDGVLNHQIFLWSF